VAGRPGSAFFSGIALKAAPTAPKKAMKNRVKIREMPFFIGKT
jgi:hypothetical protein